MNREQYQAKRMWLRGMPAGTERNSEVHTDGPPVIDEASSNPTTSSSVSLADYYQQFHHGVAPTRPDETLN